MAFFSFDTFAPRPPRGGSKAADPKSGLERSTPEAKSKRGRSPSSSDDPPVEQPAVKKTTSTASRSSRACTVDAAEERLERLAKEADDLKTCAELLRRFVGGALREWSLSLAGGAAADATADAPPSTSTLQPLVDFVSAKAVDAEEEDRIRRMCLLSLAGDHLKAQQTYLELVIGSAKWPIGGFGYISSDEARSSNRCWGQKYRNIDAKGSLLDDGTLRVALQSFKRLLTFMESRSRTT